MITATAILILSTALFFFYMQTLCEKILRREFSRPYFREVLNVIDLEFPRVRQSLSTHAPGEYSEVRLALKCDFVALTYLVKNGNPNRRRFSCQEMFLIAYFRVLLFWLPLRYAFHFRERESIVKLTVILQYFANLTGERVSPPGAVVMGSSYQS